MLPNSELSCLLGSGYAVTCTRSENDRFFRAYVFEEHEGTVCRVHGAYHPPTEQGPYCIVMPPASPREGAIIGLCLSGSPWI